MKARVVALSGFLMGSASLASALTFNFTHDPNMDANAVAGFQQAANRWSALFTDNITVNIAIGFTNLGGSILGEASSTEQVNTYADVRTALIGDAKDGIDATAVAHLQAGPGLNIQTNRFSNNPNGSGSLTPYSTSVSFMALNTANAKAIGLRSGTDPAQDATISFNSTFTWDFDPSNGITAGAYDFVGIATHEIGHALGFVSGVDYVDTMNPPDADSTFGWVMPPDLYRFKSGIGVPYLSADNTAKYFSIDSGATGSSNLFSNGVNFGDGSQASHWKDNLGLGIMDPTAAPGELLAITQLDINSFDAMGYDVVPEPATIAALALGSLALLARRKRRQ